MTQFQRPIRRQLLFAEIRSGTVLCNPRMLIVLLAMILSCGPDCSSSGHAASGLDAASGVDGAQGALIAPVVLDQVAQADSAAMPPEVDPPASALSRTVLALNQPQLVVGAQFAASDSLNVAADDNPDAQACLTTLAWQPQQFAVSLQASVISDRGDRLVRFPSPRPLGNVVNDLVSMEWHVARDSNGQPATAAAVVIVHESGRGMTVGRMIARGFKAQGLHAFLLHLPGYGERRVPGADEATSMLPALQQAIADVRRARDAVAVLPFVNARRVGLQGTSLGGFVTATVAGIDRGYDRTFILLAGGNLHDVVLNGARDAAKARQKLEAAGISRDEILELTRQVEPLRLAHRVVAGTTWLYSGMYDDVVPPACSLAFVKAAQLPLGHHIQMPADHYSGIVFLPMVIQQMAENMSAEINDRTPID